MLRGKSCPGPTKRVARMAVPAMVMVFLSSAVFGQSNHAGCDAVAGEYLLRFNASALRADGGALAAPGQLQQEAFVPLRELNAETVLFESSQVSGLMLVRASNLDRGRVELLRERGILHYLEPNCRRYPRRSVGAGRAILRGARADAAITPNDSRYLELWAFENRGDAGGTPDVDIDAPEAWSISTGRRTVVAGVLDAGLALQHEDLGPNIWVNTREIPGNGIDDDDNGYVDDVNGVNVLRGNGDVRDTANDGHGSHGAGSIGAVGDNGIGVVGVNWNVQLMALAIFEGEDLGGSAADIIKAWEYAHMMKERGENLRVLNHSFGSHEELPTQGEIDMAHRLNAAGIVLVISSGNDGGDNDVEGDTSNLNTPNAISVAAVDRRGNLADFSNFGAESVHLAAPGVDILSTIQNHGYALYSGTSQAAPIVSGVVALLVAQEPSLTPVEIRQRLLNTVKRLPGLEGTMQAPGIVSALGALTGMAP